MDEKHLAILNEAAKRDEQTDDTGDQGRHMSEPKAEPAQLNTEGMQLEYIEDRGGATLMLQVVDGRYYPIFPTDVIKNIASLKLRNDDIILAGYLKAGTHWVWEILRMLCAGTTDIPLAEKDQCMVEQQAQADIDVLPSPRILNTHSLFEQLPAEIFVKKPKIVYLTRNPKDTAVSMYHHHVQLVDYYAYRGKFEDHVRLFVDGKVDFGSWFHHIDNWSRAVRDYPDIPIMEVNYEDLSQNPKKIIQDLANYLDLSPSAELVSKIVSECSIERMRAKKAEFDLDKQGNSIMYRKGKVGSWQSYFSEELNIWFDHVYQTKMADIKTLFHWSFTLDGQQ
ncbi:unnamed protein product [Lymnaea stagnalis]|uniref:Sulfotransferase domain-containing protein n=1 Tax=Lymnaea stagnalis TaxID=6523 RepID=A0AAV2HUM5_LYMST